jgi:integration host factor subunit alpha
MENVTRDDIAEFINHEFGLSKKDCNDIVNDIIDEIISGLKESSSVKIHNFGTFKLKHKKERIGRNPKTKEDVMIQPRNVISFIPSKKIVTTLNKDIDG